MDRCPYCDVGGHPVGASYCYGCGRVLRAGGEPTFTLLARDPMAPLLVRLWAAQKWQEQADPGAVEQARHCADAMTAWRRDREAAGAVA